MNRLVRRCAVEFHLGVAPRRFAVVAVLLVLLLLLDRPAAASGVVPSGVCGNGVLEPGEQCDDHNLTDGDGCDRNCNYELIPGDGNGTPSRDRRACRAEYSVVNPHNVPPTDPQGRPYFIQTCRDGDPSCDFGSEPGACAFRVVLCVNNVDPHLPDCSPRAVRDLRLLPCATLDPQDRAGVIEALGNLRDPLTGRSGFTIPLDDTQTGMCTAPFSIRVPLRDTAPNVVAGRVLLIAVSLATPGAPEVYTDNRLTLVCTP
jgi:cysteine-rich repeat protein